jgi:putative hydrolase of HD superfamily
LVKISTITDYLLELDALKLINRKSYINGASRIENSAEHSWHLAMSCWSISKSFNLDISIEKLLKLALIHDLGEIDAGDTFLYSDKRDDAHTDERACVKRLKNHNGNAINNLHELWEEQESGQTKEAKLLKTVDRLLPFLLGIATEGKTWKELGIKKSQVLKAHAFIEDNFPQIHSWIVENIEIATKKGWLIDA